MTKPTIALIDVDSWIYRAAVAGHMELFGEDALDFEVSQKHFLGILDQTLEELEADAYVLCFGDPDHRYFRHEIAEDYKGNRNEDARPALLEDVYAWARKLPNSVSMRNVEAEDVCSIIATCGELPFEDWRLIRVGEDKDLMTVPGEIYRRGEVVYVTGPESLYNLCYQALVGDSVDGYSGCPKVGPKKATEWLTNLCLHKPYDHEFKRGPRKGTTETRWEVVANEADCVFDVVDSCFCRYADDEVLEGFEQASKQLDLAKILDYYDGSSVKGMHAVDALIDAAQELIEQQLEKQNETDY